MATDHADTQAVHVPTKKSIKSFRDIHQLLSLLGYYKRYINEFSKIARILYDLLKQELGKKVVRRNPYKRKDGFMIDIIKSSGDMDVSTSISIE